MPSERLGPEAAVAETACCLHPALPPTPCHCKAVFKNHSLKKKLKTDSNQQCKRLSCNLIFLHLQKGAQCSFYFFNQNEGVLLKTVLKQLVPDSLESVFPHWWSPQVTGQPSEGGQRFLTFALSSVQWDLCRVLCKTQCLTSNVSIRKRHTCLISKQRHLCIIVDPCYHFIYAFSYSLPLYLPSRSWITATKQAE